MRSLKKQKNEKADTSGSISSSRLFGRRKKQRDTISLQNRSKKISTGNRIVMFAPLYLSNYCVNGCTYCPYHDENKHIMRKQLSQEEIRREVIALQDMGHKRLALEAGEDPVRNTMDYYLESIKIDLQHQT